MNGKLGLSGISLVFSIALLSACGGGSGGSSGNSGSANGTQPPINSTTPPANAGSGSGSARAAPFAYVTNSGSNKNTGSISAYTVDASTGALAQIAGSPFQDGVVGGTGPSSFAVDPLGRFGYATTFSRSTITTYAIDTSGAIANIGEPVATGTLPRAIVFSPSGQFVYTVNFGPDNNVSAFRMDAGSGALSAVPGSPYRAGSQPVMIAFLPSGKFAYVVNRNSADISGYSVDPLTGSLTSIGTTPAGVGANFIAIGPSGRFVYATNDDAHNVSAYVIDQATGALSELAGSPYAAGTFPRSIGIHPSGKFAYVANESSQDVYIYSIDPSSGALSRIGTVPLDAHPLFVTVDPTGKFAYVVARWPAYLTTYPGRVSVYSISAAGMLTEIAGSPFAAGDASTWIAFGGPAS